MKKIIGFVMCVLLIMTLMSCKKEQSNRALTKNSYSEVTEDTSEAEKIIAEMMQQIKEDEKKRLAEKEKRMASKEPLIEITGEIIDTLTKPESGLDIYQLTVKVSRVENDKNNLYENAENKEYEYFVSPSEFKQVEFKTLHKGTVVKIKIFQDASITKNMPQQTSEDDVAGIEVIKK